MSFSVAKWCREKGAGKSNMWVKIIVNTASAFHACKVTLNIRRERSKGRKEGWEIPNRCLKALSRLQLRSPGWPHNCTHESVPLPPWQREGKQFCLKETQEEDSQPVPPPLQHRFISGRAGQFVQWPPLYPNYREASQTAASPVGAPSKGLGSRWRRFISTVQELKKSLSSLDTGDIAISTQTAHPHLTGPICVLLIFHTPELGAVGAAGQPPVPASQTQTGRIYLLSCS